MRVDPCVESFRKLVHESNATVGAVTQVAHALAEPLEHLAERPPGSIRRSSHLDVVTLDDGRMEVTGAAYQSGDWVTLAASLDARRTLLSLSVEPAVPQSASLIGKVVARGFRRAVDDVSAEGTLARVLLNELPVIALLSGYGSLYVGHLPTPLSDDFIGGLPVDICAGWARSGSMMVHVRRQRRSRHRCGPEVPDDARQDGIRCLNWSRARSDASG